MKRSCTDLNPPESVISGQRGARSRQERCAEDEMTVNEETRSSQELHWLAGLIERQPKGHTTLLQPFHSDPRGLD